MRRALAIMGAAVLLVITGCSLSGPVAAVPALYLAARVLPAASRKGARGHGA